MYLSHRGLHSASASAGRRAALRRTVAAGVATLSLAATALLTPPAAGVRSSAEAPAGGHAVGSPKSLGAQNLDGPVLDAALERVIEEGQAVGAVAEVRSGAEVWRGAAGRSRLDPDRRARPGSQFRAASVTKIPVAVLALQLVAEGTWSLDTTIGDVLPELWPERSAVTLRQLLSHTSGMPDGLVSILAGATTTEALVEAVSVRRTDAELVRAAQSLPWLFEPGAGFTYSNAGHVVVGMMLRAETGETLPELVRTRVLRPARMRHSRLATSPLIVAPWLREYTVMEGALVDLASFHPTLFGAAGALLTTTQDLNRFHRALSTGKLLPKRWVREMRTPVHSDPTTGLEYGLGSYRLPDPCRPGGFVHGHDGTSLGTLTLSFSSPDGRRRVTAAATGRSVDDPTRPGVALAEMAGAALRQTCDDTTATSRRAAPRIPTTPDPLQLLASLR